MYQVIDKSPEPIYCIEDLEGEKIVGSFYAAELQHIEHVKDSDKVWTVEKVLRRRKAKNGKTELLVKWFGYLDKFNSYIPESELVSIRG